MTDKIVFHLMRFWHDYSTGTLKIIDLEKEIMEGRKTSEWRDASPYWAQRLFKNWKSIDFKMGGKTQDLTEHLKARHAWLIFGFPKGNIPRMEIDIKKVFLHPETQQFEIQFENLVVVK